MDITQTFYDNMASQYDKLFFDQTDGFQEGFVALAAGIFQTPVFPMGAGRLLWYR